MPTENSLKMVKNGFYFIIKALFILKVFKFLSLIFGHVEEQFDKETKFNFELHGVTDWKKYN